MDQVPELEAIALKKTLVKGGLAAAAPGLAALVAAFSVSKTELLSTIHLGPLGLTSAGVLFFFMAYLFLRCRWTAGIPGLLCSALAVALFTVKIARPLSMYYEANPINDFFDVVAPLQMVALQVSIVMISLTLGLVILKTMLVSRRLSPMPINRLFWGVLIIWGGLLAYDGYHQNMGWRSFGSGRDLAIRLCIGPEEDRVRAANRLFGMGSEAVPDLLEVMNETRGSYQTVGRCIHEQVKSILVDLGGPGREAIVKAAEDGDNSAREILASR